MSPADPRSFDGFASARPDDADIEQVFFDGQPAQGDTFDTWMSRIKSAALVPDQPLTGLGSTDES